MAALPLAPFVRFVVAKSLVYWATHGGLGIFDHASESDPLDLRRSVLTFDKPGAAPISTRDPMMTSVVWMKTSGGLVDGTWDDDGLDTITLQLKAFWTAIKYLYPSTLELRDITWYAEGPDVTPPNPMIRRDLVGVTGGLGTQGLPPQVASTITLLTSSRKHWGRMYLPSPAAGVLDVADSKDGRWDHATVDTFAQGFADACAALYAAGGYVPVVWSPTAQAALGVVGIQCDDVPDVIRNRRFATTGYKKLIVE